MKITAAFVLMFCMVLACEPNALGPTPTSTPTPASTPDSAEPQMENLNEVKLTPSPTTQTDATIPDWAKAIILPVDGMTCQGCEQAINESLKKLEGVFRSKANHLNGSVHVHYDPQKVRPAHMVNTINELGYQSKLEKADPDLKLFKHKSPQELQGHEKIGKKYFEKIKTPAQQPAKAP